MDDDIPGWDRLRASSYAWKVGEPLHREMDNYNNGMCARHIAIEGRPEGRH